MKKETKAAKKDKALAKRQAEIKGLALNQKLRLAVSTMRLGDWESSFVLLKDQYFCPGTYPPVAIALIGRIESLVSELYRPYVSVSYFELIIRLSPDPITQAKRSTDLTLPSVTNLSQFVEHVFPMLYLVGPFIALDTVVFCKVCRVLASLCSSDPTVHEPGQTAKLVNLIGKTILFVEP